MNVGEKNINCLLSVSRRGVQVNLGLYPKPLYLQEKSYKCVILTCTDFFFKKYTELC